MKARDRLAKERAHIPTSPIFETGAFADLSPPVLARTLVHATNAYFTANVRLTCTNLQAHPPSALRVHVIEAANNKPAEAMGIDAIQRANLYAIRGVFHYEQLAAEAHS